MGLTVNGMGSVDPGGSLDPLASALDRRPDAVAVTDGRRSWSYRELAAAADRLGAVLGPPGPLGPEETDTVAVVLPPSPDGVAAIHGVLRMGALLAPLNPALTVRETADALAVLRPRTVLVDRDTAGPTRDAVELARASAEGAEGAEGAHGGGTDTTDGVAPATNGVTDATDGVTPATGDVTDTGARWSPDVREIDGVLEAETAGRGPGRAAAPMDGSPGRSSSAASPARSSPDGSLARSSADGSPRRSVPAASPDRSPAIDATRPAAVLWTSGTSGRPRGVLLTGAALRHSAEACARRLELGPDDRWYASLSPAHVGGLALVTRAALLGSALVATGPFRVEELHELIRSGAVTHASLVPTMLRRLLDHRGDAPPPPSLRCLLVGGAACPLPLLERAHSAGLPVALTWGMTETTSQAATAPPDLVRRKPGTVGRPLDGVEVRIEPVADEPDVQDGEHVQDGQDGQAGQEGRGGHDVQTGQDGQNGQDGRGGHEVQDGQGGQNGQAGRGGREVQDGPDGPDGQDGRGSQHDQNGSAGSPGSSGGDGPKARAGEIHVRGPVVAAGLVGSDELLVHADGWLATGDLGELDDDGHLRITGRRSDRIITGGVNVDPAEVEAVLLGHPEVAEGAVVGLPDPVWGERVTAAVVAAPGSEPEGEAVRAWLRERLTGAKVPKEVTVVPSLPRNPNGKIDRAALRATLEAAGPDSFRRGRPGHT